ncbi:PrpF domain-containing protein [Faunimonas sp. B44]|uniref:PrpF domain-containing protein n=1 Tax=Faunimonas sp. B44 TaxID=3461493 RepID=UPI00404519E0
MTILAVVAPVADEPRLRNGFLEFPIYHMRGGTSSGIVVWARLFPEDVALREELIRHIMGVPIEGTVANNKQITGLGRGIPKSNKVFLADIEADDCGRARIVSTLAQLAAEKSAIDWSVNCGNMSAALPLWAYDAGLLEVGSSQREFWVDIRNTNTGIITGSRMIFSEGSRLDFCTIPGVDGSFPEVDLFLNDPVGNKTGHLLPTGQVEEVVDGVRVTCMDVAVPMVMIRASDLGKTANEPMASLDKDVSFKERLRNIWVECGLRMGLKGRNGVPLTPEQLATSETVPKVCIVGEAQGAGHISARYFTPQSGHNSMAVSGGCCLAAACLLEGSVPRQLARDVPVPTETPAEYTINIANPAGILTALVDASVCGGSLSVTRAAYTRSAQVLLQGYGTLYRASDALTAAVMQKAAKRKLYT